MPSDKHAPTHLKTKQPTPPLPKRINNQRAQEQPNRNPNRHLDHRIPHVENHAIDVGTGCESLGSVGDRCGPRRIACDLVGGSYAADKRPTGGQARGHLDEDGGEESGSGNAMMEAGVEVSKYANAEGAKGVCNLGIGGEALGGEEVDNVAGESNDEHDRSLVPLRLVDDD